VSLQQAVTPVVEIPANQAEEVGVADVLIGSFGLVGAMVILALLVGLTTGGLFILYRRWRDKREPELPEDQHTRLRLSQ
jgi:hypothetical protein